MYKPLRITEKQFLDRFNSLGSQKIKIVSRFFGMSTPLHVECLTCKKVWRMGPYSILKNKGCRLCSRRVRVKKQDLVLKEIHPDLNRVGDWVGSKVKTRYRCEIHNHEWYPTPNNLRKGQGCPKCAGFLTHDERVVIATTKRGGEFGYTKSDFSNTKIPTLIECLKHPEHGFFKQTYNNHINLCQGCPKCGALNRGRKGSIC